MTQPAVDEASQVLDKAKEMIGSTDANALWDVLQATNNALTAAKANNAAYDAYKVAYDALMEAASDPEANFEALDEFTNEEETFNNFTELTTEELEALTVKAEELTAALKTPNGEASDDNPLDYTSLIVNPDYEDGNSTGWSGTAPGGYSSGTPEIYNQSFDFHQTLHHLQAGTYQLSVQAFNRKPAQGPQADYDAWKAGEKYSYQNAYLYATVGEKTYSEALCMIAEGAQNSQWLGDNWSTINTGETSEEGAEIQVYTPQNLSTAHEYLNTEYDEEGNEVTLYLNTLTFTLQEPSDVVIGLKALTGDNWCAFDNWHLLYFGTESSKEDSGDAVAIDGIANNVPVEAIYTVSGTRVSRLQKGVNIVRLSNGTIQKVLVK